MRIKKDRSKGTQTRGRFRKIAKRRRETFPFPLSSITHEIKFTFEGKFYPSIKKLFTKPIEPVLPVLPNLLLVMLDKKKDCYNRFDVIYFYNVGRQADLRPSYLVTPRFLKTESK